MILMGASAISPLYFEGLNWRTTDWRDGRVAEGGGLLKRGKDFSIFEAEQIGKFIGHQKAQRGILEHTFCHVFVM
jgi:hypothetical protein